MTGIVVGVVIAIVVIAGIVVAVSRKGKNAGHTEDAGKKTPPKSTMKRMSRLPAAMLDDHIYDVKIYSYSRRMRSIDDITGMRMSVYRESGTIEDYGDPVYKKESFRPDKTMVDELGTVTMTALETKRANDIRTLYFILADALEDLHEVTQPEIVMIREVVASELMKDRNVLISIDRMPI